MSRTVSRKSWSNRLEHDLRRERAESRELTLERLEILTRRCEGGQSDDECRSEGGRLEIAPAGNGERDTAEVAYPNDRRGDGHARSSGLTHRR